MFDDSGIYTSCLVHFRASFDLLLIKTLTQAQENQALFICLVLVRPYFLSKNEIGKTIIIATPAMINDSLMVCNAASSIAILFANK